MIICPIENNSLFTWIDYIQVRPKISQVFWDDFIRAEDWMLNYASMGLKWHNWIDFKVPAWTPIYSPIDWIIKTKDDWRHWYWLCIKLRNPYKWIEIVLAHLSNTIAWDGKKVYQWDLLWYSWNTWSSTWPHLHLGMRKIENCRYVKNVFKKKVLNYDNWFLWYIDPLPFMITFKWTLKIKSLYNQQ